MRGRLVQVTFIALLSGFVLQLAIDSYSWSAFINDQTAPNGRTVRTVKTAYQYFREGTFERGACETIPKQRTQKRVVMCEGMLLFWLERRMPEACRMAGAIACLSLTSLYFCSREKRKVITTP
jgi:hypothetical protein